MPFLQFSVTDADEKENGKVQTSIVTSGLPFSMSTDGRQVLLAQSLNETFKPLYSLVIEAVDMPLDISKQRFVERLTYDMRLPFCG